MATLEEIPKVVLHVTEGPQSGERFEFTDHQTCIIGRSPEAQIRLSENRQFSRFHCRLEIKPPSVVVVDLRSTNGTRVNGKRVETASLNDGDIVNVGDTAFTVSVETPKEKCSLPAETSLVNRRLEPTNFAANDGFFSADDNPASSPLPEIPGYVIERELGQGAMGAVYSARLRSTNELVAIKVMKPVVVTSRKAVEKFRREACIGLRLQHKRIVRFIDFGVTEGDLPYLVMEYVDAFNIREYLNSLELAERVRVAVGIVVRTLEGLQFAHSQKIVHRDVKLTKSGWTVFSLLDASGNKIEANCARCPKTTALVESLPSMNGTNAWTMAYFSIMAPGTHVRRHMGPGNLKRRYHLGLEVPERDSYLMVHNRIASWRNNECIVFDDSYKHEVFHQSDQRRVVFIVDIPHPELTAAERDFFNKLAIATQGTSLAEDVYARTDAQRGAPQA